MTSGTMEQVTLGFVVNSPCTCDAHRCPKILLLSEAANVRPKSVTHRQPRRPPFR